MRQNSGSTIQVPRVMSYFLMAEVFPLFPLVINIIGDPRLHGVRSLEVLRLIGIGLCAGMFFSGLLLFIKSKSDDRTLAASNLDQTNRPSSTT